MNTFTLILALPFLLDAVTAAGNLRASNDSEEAALSGAWLSLPYMKDYTLGRGVNALTGKPGYEHWEFSKTDRQGAYELHYSSLSTVSLEETERAIDFAAKAEGGGYGVSLGPGIEFTTSKKQSTESVSFIAAISVKSFYERVRASNAINPDPRFLDDLRACKSITDDTERRSCFNRFTDNYGTHYISGIQYGGNVFSRVTIETTSKETTDKIAVELSGGFKSIKSPVNGGGKFKAGLARAERMKDVKISQDYYVRGKTDARFGSSDIDVVLKAISEFGENLQNKTRAGVPLYVVLEEWENIPAVKAVMGDEKIVERVDPETIEALGKAYGTLTSLYKKTITMFEGTHWQKNVPKALVDGQLGKRNELASVIYKERSEMKNLTISELAKMIPTSDEFRKKYLTANTRNKEVNDLYEFEIPMSAHVIHGGLAAACEGRTAFSFPAWKMAVGTTKLPNLKEVMCRYDNRVFPGVKYGVLFSNGKLGLIADVREFFGGQTADVGTLISRRWVTGERSDVILPHHGTIIRGQIE